MKPIIRTYILLATLLLTACKKDKTASAVPPPVQPIDTVKLRLVNTTYIPGNLQAGGLDTFTLYFSKPVHLNTLFFLSSYCSPNLEHILTNGDSVVRFYNFKCGGLGGDYPFEYAVTDSSGNKLTDSVTYHCYYHRSPVAGSIQNYFLSHDGAYCWILTYAPNQVVRLNVGDTGQRQTFDLSFQPLNAAFNPYNQLLYLTAVNYPQRDSVFVMDPSNGQIVKRIHLPEDTTGAPDDFGQDIQFASNGYGMLGVNNNGGTARWLVIDSRAADTIYPHPYFSTVFLSRLQNLLSKTVNYDGTKIIGLEEGGGARLGVLDCNTQALTEVAFPFSSSPYGTYMVASKATDEEFVVSVQPPGQNQFLVQNFAMVGVFTGFDAYNASSADYSYRPGENAYIYYFDGGIAGVVDYSSGNIIKNTDVNSTLSRLTSTPDGKYILFTGTSNVTMIESSKLYP